LIIIIRWETVTASAQASAILIAVVMTVGALYMQTIATTTTPMLEWLLGL
jgi:hypothetical protein